jgi:hypothetical protein
VKAQDEKIEAMTEGIKPMLDCIGFEPSEGREQLPRDLPPRSIMYQCLMAWSDFNAAHGAIVHAIAQLRSHYPSVDLQRVVTEYAQGTDAMKIARLEDEAKEMAKRLVGDVDLFGKGGCST